MISSSNGELCQSTIKRCGELCQSPIKICSVENIYGSDTIKLYFYDACTTDDVKYVSQSLNILFHTKENMICEVLSTSESLNINTMVIIGKVNYQWLKGCPIIKHVKPIKDLNEFLNTNFYRA